MTCGGRRSRAPHVCPNAPEFHVRNRPGREPVIETDVCTHHIKFYWGLPHLFEITPLKRTRRPETRGT